MTRRAQVIITRPLPGDPVALLRDAGCTDVWMYGQDRGMPRAELLEAIRGAEAVIATPADTRVDREFFEAAGESLRIVSNYAVGVDNVDLDEAQRCNVIIGHTPDAVTEPTADIAWLLLLAAARRAHEGETIARSGRWNGIGPNQLLGQRVMGRSLLIVGAGRIGLAVARRSIGWNMRVLYCARTPKPDMEALPVGARRVDLDAGLAAADFVSLHTPLTTETHHLFDGRRLALMKRTAVLINTARGAVVDEAALVDALQGGVIAAAGLDVYEHEPRIHEGLRGLPNVFLMPHAGSATVDDRAWMTRMAVANVIAVLKGTGPLYAVTAPGA